MNPTAREALLEWLRTPTTVCTGDFTTETAMEADNALRALRVAAGAPKGAEWIAINVKTDALAWLEQPTDGDEAVLVTYREGDGWVVDWPLDGCQISDHDEPLFRVVGIDPEGEPT